MKDNEHRNDILIGKDQWIAFVDISDRRDSAINVDYLLLRVERLWDALETFCMAGCCGIDAFDFYPDNLAMVTTTLGKGNLRSELAYIQNELEDLPGEVFVSSRLNQYFHKSVLLQLLKHISENLRQTKHQ